jgi:hypothetical protein
VKKTRNAGRRGGRGGRGGTGRRKPVAAAPVTAEELRSVRAVAVLRAIGTSDARAVLETLAKGMLQ